MKLTTIIILTLFFTTCSSKNSKKNIVNRINLMESSDETDSCFVRLYIDKNSVETPTLNNLWISAEKLGYTFTDDTIVPFVKIIFQPKTAKYYSDTLKISDCKIFDSINIHKMEIRSSKPVDKDYYAVLKVQEWEFKNTSAATEYANALANYYGHGLGLKSPTAVLLTNQSVYIFETAAYKFIPQMEAIEKLLSPEAKVYVTNY